jgi:hypothetical protein
VAGGRTVVRVAGALAALTRAVTTIRGRRRVTECRHRRRQQQRCGKGRRNAPHGKLRHDDPPSPSGAPYVRHLCSLIRSARHAVNAFGAGTGPLARAAGEPVLASGAAIGLLHADGTRPPARRRLLQVDDRTARQDAPTPSGVRCRSPPDLAGGRGSLMPAS